jgi:hypothetical protein
MIPLKHIELDQQTFAEIARKQGVIVESMEDLTGKVPHTGFGGAEKSKYESPSGRGTIYVLERNHWYAGDAYANDVWSFDRDFTVEEAAEFLREIDKSKPFL